LSDIALYANPIVNLHGGTVKQMSHLLQYLLTYCHSLAHWPTFLILLLPYIICRAAAFIRAAVSFLWASVYVTVSGTQKYIIIEDLKWTTKTLSVGIT